MATKLTPFRLPPDTLDELAALAASNGGNLTTAVKEAAAQFRALVEEVGRANADDLTHEEWVRLGHLNDPDPMGELVEDGPTHGTDWSQRLAAELLGMWEGRDTTLPLHRAESKECAKLAKRIAGWGRLRGYALMCALRHFWREPSAGIESCAAPEVWMTPTKRD
jgi:hypothetical protein